LDNVTRTRTTSLIGHNLGEKREASVVQSEQRLDLSSDGISLKTMFDYVAL